ALAFAVTTPAGGPAAAMALGIQTAADGANIISGTPLQLGALADQVFVVPAAANQPTLSASIDLAAAGVSAAARLGLVAITAAGGTVSGHLALNVLLRDPGTPADNRVTLHELTDHLLS